MTAEDRRNQRAIDHDRRGQRAYLWIFYQGPWDRLSNWIWQHGEVKDDSIRDRIACFCDERDFKWREKFVARGTKPSAMWERRTK